MKVVINKTATAKLGRQIISDSKEFDDNVKRLLSIIDNINTAWEGQEATKYINVLKDKHIVGLHKLADTIGEYGEYLENVPEAYALLDESFATKNINV